MISMRELQDLSVGRTACGLAPETSQTKASFSYTNRVLEEKSSGLSWEQGRSRERRGAVGSAGHVGTSNHIKLKKCPPPIFLSFVFFSYIEFFLLVCIWF